MVLMTLTILHPTAFHHLCVSSNTCLKLHTCTCTCCGGHSESTCEQPVGRLPGKPTKGKKAEQKVLAGPLCSQTKDSTTAHPKMRGVCRAWTALGYLYRYMYVSLLGFLWLFFSVPLQYGKTPKVNKRREDIIINSHVLNIRLKKWSTHR